MKTPRFHFPALARFHHRLAATRCSPSPFRIAKPDRRERFGEGTYPVPYQLPTVAEVTEALARVRDYLEVAAPTRVIDSATGKEITDFATPVATAVLDRAKRNSARSNTKWAWCTRRCCARRR